MWKSEKWKDKLQTESLYIVTYIEKRSVFKIYKEFLQIHKKKSNKKKTEQRLEQVFYKRGNMNGQ